MPTRPTGLPARVRGFIAPRLSDSAVWAAMLDAPVASLACDDAGVLLFANGAMIDLLGRPLEKLLGGAWIELLCARPSDVAEVLKSPGTLRHRKQLTPDGGDLREGGVCGDLDGRVLEMTCSAVKLPDGGRGMVAIAVESPSVTINTGRLGGERNYRELVEDSPDVLGRFDADSGRVLFLNRAVERVTGATPEELKLDPSLWPRTIAPEYRAQWEAALAQVRQGDARSFDLGLLHRDGRRIILQQALYPIRDAQGAVRYIEGSARDITAVRQIEALKAKNEERVSLDRLKSQLLANVSHELRTPLVSIKGYNELLLRGALGPLTARMKRGLEIAGANTERLIDLIETLLDFARREEGRLELRTARLDLRQAVEDAVHALGERSASRSLKLRLELGAQPLSVVGDRTRLAQVFRALLGNAEKFSEGASGEIVIAAASGPDWVAISFTDRGIGIPKEAHARIFDRFYQVDASSTRRFGGAGLGLALAKELVTLHGGAILLDSAEGRGSTFTVRLPRATRETHETPVETIARPVLLVGATDETWRALKPALETEALNPYMFCAYSPPEVLVRARRHRPDLVLLAFTDAGELARTTFDLKQDPETRALPVVALVADGLAVAHADLVVDPAEPVRLINGILRLLGRLPAAPRRPRVVVVEDELEILDFTRFVLEREGYEVMCVSEGEQALAAIDGDCDLVVLDIALEGSDGIEVCRRLKTAPETRDVPILIMTAMSGDEVRELSLKAGAEGYLMKPFGVDEFLRQVQLHLRAAREDRLDMTDVRA